MDHGKERVDDPDERAIIRRQARRVKRQSLLAAAALTLATLLVP
jgi:hypothetical protein